MGHDDFSWQDAEHAQQAGQAPQIINGQLVPARHKPDNAPDAITLTDDRFAATNRESAEVYRLVSSGTAATLIADLRPTEKLPEYHLRPGAWYLATKQTPSYRDVLHTVIEHRPATGLYHANLWRFMQNDGGELKSVNLNRWVGAHQSLSAHNVHLYQGHNGQAATLCLSQRTMGGMPTLTGAVLQAAKWADGMGYVVRGRKFPYRQ